MIHASAVAFNESPSTAVMLLGFALAALIPAAFLLGLRRGITALLMIRPLCDRLFEAGRFDIAGHSLSYGVLINFTVICVSLLTLGSILRRVPNGLRGMWVPFLLVAFASALYSPIAIDGLRKFVTYVTFAAMFMLPFVAVKSEEDFIYYLKVVVYSSILPVFYGLFQMLSGLDWYKETRIHSTFSHPNIFAFYVLATMGAILFLMIAYRGSMSGRVRLALTVYLVPMIIVLIATKTRSAWISCFLIVLIYGVAYDKRALLSLVVAPLVAFAVPVINDRIVDLTSRGDYIGGSAGANLNAYAWRQLLWENAFTYIWQQPIFGYGLDSFHYYSPLFFPLVPNGTEAHNVYVQLIFETGFIGLCAYLWIFCRSLAWSVRFGQRDRRSLLMIVGILASYTVYCFSDNILEYLSFNWCFWFCCGLFFARIALIHREGLNRKGAFAAQNQQRLGIAGVSHVREARRGVAS